MGGRAQERGRVRGAGPLTVALRALAALVLTLGVLLVTSPAAFGAEPAPAPAPAPYGGALDVPEAGDVFSAGRALEVAMLALGSVNGLAFTGVVIVSRFRGSNADATRRALMSRTTRGVPSGPRR